MGLDTSHDCWHGPYSRFARWREHVRTVAEFAEPEWNKYELKNYAGEWDVAPEDPLTVLIVHSDCGGEIKLEHTMQLAGRLNGLLGKISPEWQEETLAFILGLKLAAASGESVDFH